jgi:hypothetical protein
MRTSEDIILDAAKANGWRVSKDKSLQKNAPGLVPVYDGWWLNRKQQTVQVWFDRVDHGLMYACTGNHSREFEGRNEVIEYLEA